MVLLKTLGGLSLVGDRLAPAAMQRRRLALLVLLARGTDRGVSRDTLLAYLWPESSSDNARHALDQLLYATRRDLGRGTVLSEGGRLWLDAERVRADCTEFEARLERGELERAVALYAGPFLEGAYLGGGVELERWVESERAALAERFHVAVERLAAEAETRGYAVGAVGWWRRRASSEPLNARVARELVRALAESGDGAGALRHARDHAALVGRELGLDPDPALQAFAEAVARRPVAVVELPRTLEAALEPWSGAIRASVARRAAPAWRIGGLAGGLVLVLAAAGIANRSPEVLSPVRRAIAGSEGFSAAPEKAAGRSGVDASAPDPVAHELYLRGRIAWNQRTAAGLTDAVVLFRDATERSPTYAAAYAGLADAYVLLGYLGYVPGQAAFPKGKAVAERAIALDPTLGEAYASLGKALQWEGRWREAEEAFQRALEHAPVHATAHQWYALMLTILGRTEEAVPHARRAAELDPLSIQVQNTYGVMLYNAGAVDSALSLYERLVTLEPDTAWVRQNPWVLTNFGKIAAAAGRHAEAVRLIERAVRAVPGHPRPLFDLASAWVSVGDMRRARAAFARADPEHPHYPVYRAFLHARLGELDEAFEWLERVEEWALPSLGVLSGSPVLRGLRADPRYPELRRSLGLPAPG